MPLILVTLLVSNLLTSILLKFSQPQNMKAKEPTPDPVTLAVFIWELLSYHGQNKAPVRFVITPSTSNTPSSSNDHDQVSYCPDSTLWDASYNSPSIESTLSSSTVGSSVRISSDDTASVDAASVVTSSVTVTSSSVTAVSVAVFTFVSYSAAFTDA